MSRPFQIVLMLAAGLLAGLSTGCDEDVNIGTGGVDDTTSTSEASASQEDSDFDGLSDDVEDESRVGTEDLVADTDQDGFSDGLEFISQAGDPLNSLVVPNSEARARNRLPSEITVDSIDRDQDGLGSNFESDFDLDDNNEDIDDDGFTDALELIAGSDPFSSSSVPNRAQPPASDGIERTGTGPIDRDQDGISDEREAFFGYDPTNRDSDGDGFSDGIEFLMGSQALDAVNIPNFLVPNRPDTIS